MSTKTIYDTPISMRPFYLLVSGVTVIIGSYFYFGTAFAQLFGGGSISPHTGICSPPASKGYLIEKIVSCFTSANLPSTPINDHGFIGWLTFQMLQQMSPYFMTITTIMILIAIGFFGIRLSVGVVKRNSALREAWILLFKIGFLWLIVSQLALIYDIFIGSIEDLTLIVGNAAQVTAPHSQCVVPNGETMNVWKRWDCSINLVIGITGGASVVAGVAGVLFAYFVAAITTAGAGAALGVLVFFSIATMVTVVLFTMVRAVHVYLIAFMAASFMCIVAPLFLPFILFKTTYLYFSKWLKLLLAFIIQPIMLVAFLGFGLVAVEQTFFYGQYSLYRALIGDAIDNPKQFVGNYIGEKAFVANTKVGTMEAVSDPRAYDTKDDQIANSALAGPMAISQETNPNRVRQEESNIGVQANMEMPTIDINKLKDTNRYNGATKTLLQYMTDVTMSAFASVLLMLVLYSMVWEVPKLATYVTTGAFEGGSIATSAIFGEAAVKKMRAIAVEAAKAKATGGKSLMTG